jgi:hypothetical protein
MRDGTHNGQPSPSRGRKASPDILSADMLSYDEPRFPRLDQIWHNANLDNPTGFLSHNFRLRLIRLFASFKMEGIVETPISSGNSFRPIPASLPRINPV